jgi:hypothetical protein
MPCLVRNIAHRPRRSEMSTEKWQNNDCKGKIEETRGRSAAVSNVSPWPPHPVTRNWTWSVTATHSLCLAMVRPFNPWKQPASAFCKLPVDIGLYWLPPYPKTRHHTSVSFFPKQHTLQDTDMKPFWGCLIQLTVLVYTAHQPEHLRIQGKAVMRLFMNDS